MSENRGAVFSSRFVSTGDLKEYTVLWIWLKTAKNTSYLWMKWSFHLIKDTQALHNCTICKKTRGIRFWKLRININGQWETRQLTRGRFLVLDKLQNILTTHFSNHPFDTIKTLGKVKTHASGFSQTHTKKWCKQGVFSFLFLLLHYDQTQWLMLVPHSPSIAFFLEAENQTNTKN